MRRCDEGDRPGKEHWGALGLSKSGTRMKEGCRRQTRGYGMQQKRCDLRDCDELPGASSTASSWPSLGHLYWGHKGDTVNAIISRV